MSIASAIVNKQQQVASCYTAISNKGGTLPVTQNVANMPTAINSIPSGGGSTKYGCTIDNLLGNVDANGILQMPSDTSGDIVFNGVKDITAYGLYYKFSSNSNLTRAVSFPDLESITGHYAMYNTFEGDDNISAVSLPKLKTVTGIYAMHYAFYGTKITSFSLPELTEISNYSGCGNICRNCVNLVTASLPKLSVLTGSIALSNGFYGCTRLTDIYFNSLTTTSFGSYPNQFNNMMNNTGTTTTHTLHFPSNLQSTISGLTGYPLFGGASGYVVLAFDLPATS